jgi:hypothetical protein
MNLENIPDEAIDLLSDYCDFQIGATPSGLAMLPESAELKLIAGDGMGGCFYEWLQESEKSQAPIVYLSQYGETSRVSSNLEELLSFIVTYEEWVSVLVAATKDHELFKKVSSNKEMDEEREEACNRIKQLIPEIPEFSNLIYESINKTPAFVPTLMTEEGPEEPSLFKERPYPN